MTVISPSQETGDGGGINRFKTFITADITFCIASGYIGKLGAQADIVAGVVWLSPFLVSSSTSTPMSVNCCLGVLYES